MTPRKDEIAAFLAAAGWDKAQHCPLAGDASARRYSRLTFNGRSAILMDTPQGCADDPAQFLMIADHLAGLSLSPPRCFAKDLGLGLLLLEDLGDALFARLLVDNPQQEQALYAGAVDVLCAVQSSPAPQGLPNLSAPEWADAAMLVVSDYCAAITGAAIMGAAPQSLALNRALSDAIGQNADGPRVLILRDFHAENLLHLPNRSGAARVGLLDFQLGQLGQPCYDLVSLLQDARRDVRPETQSQMIALFLQKTGAEPAAFLASYACFGAQRALRILGIFTRLCMQNGKAGYVDLIPRVWGHLQRNLAHPALSTLAQTCREILPEPTPAALEKIRSQCRTIL